jgi:hypothetical protein
MSRTLITEMYLLISTATSWLLPILWGVVVGLVFMTHLTMSHNIEEIVYKLNLNDIKREKESSIANLSDALIAKLL